jgi:hypothetical protein
MKLIRLIKMCLNETCSNVRIGKYLSDNFPIQNGLKQGDAECDKIWNLFVKQVNQNTDVDCNNDKDDDTKIMMTVIIK